MRRRRGLFVKAVWPLPQDIKKKISKCKDEKSLILDLSKTEVCWHGGRGRGRGREDRRGEWLAAGSAKIAVIRGGMEVMVQPASQEPSCIAAT